MIFIKHHHDRGNGNHTMQVIKVLKIKINKKFKLFWMLKPFQWHLNFCRYPRIIWLDNSLLFSSFLSKLLQLRTANGALIKNVIYFKIIFSFFTCLWKLANYLIMNSSFKYWYFFVSWTNKLSYLTFNCSSSSSKSWNIFWIIVSGESLGSYPLASFCSSS